MAIYTKKSGVNNHPEATVLQEFTDLVRKSGVVLPSTHFKVTEKSPASMAVLVQKGSAYIKGSTGNCYPVWSDAVAEVAIDPNTSGNTRIDSIVLYIDHSVTPVATGQGADVAKVVAVKGTPAPSPQALSDSAIQTAIGSNNPFFVRGLVTVQHNATSITAENITNLDQRVFMKTPSPEHDVAFSSTITPDYLNGSQQAVKLTGNITINTPTNMEVGDWLVLKFTQDATGGRTVTFFSGIKWMSADYSVNATANKITEFAIKKTAIGYQGYLNGKEY